MTETADVHGTALLLIAHGSRRPEANADLEYFAREVQARGEYAVVQPCFLELVEPGIEEGGARCAAAGATEVILLPFFLSPGVHAIEDLATARDALAARFPAVRFTLAEPLGRHPLLIDIIEQRAREAK